jgi:hypothetical protein
MGEVCLYYRSALLLKYGKEKRDHNRAPRHTAQEGGVRRTSHTCLEPESLALPKRVGIALAYAAAALLLVA